MQSELIFRGHESPSASQSSYSPKPTAKQWASVTRPIRYMLQDQRFLFLLIGVAIATLLFTFSPSSSPADSHRLFDSFDYLPATTSQSKFSYADTKAFGSGYRTGKVPLGMKLKARRIVVTGGAGFVGSHLVDRLIARGDSVIVVDNFFTGRKENVMHHFGNPNFELIRHDVVEPILLEVDQIYHLACPASPVHYKFNPVKTIISFY